MRMTRSNRRREAENDDNLIVNGLLHLAGLFDVEQPASVPEEAPHAANRVDPPSGRLEQPVRVQEVSNAASSVDPPIGRLGENTIVHWSLNDGSWEVGSPSATSIEYNTSNDTYKVSDIVRFIPGITDSMVSNLQVPPLANQGPPPDGYIWGTRLLGFSGSLTASKFRGFTLAAHDALKALRRLHRATKLAYLSPSLARLQRKRTYNTMSNLPVMAIGFDNEMQTVHIADEGQGLDPNITWIDTLDTREGDVNQLFLRANDVARIYGKFAGRKSIPMRLSGETYVARTRSARVGQFNQSIWRVLSFDALVAHLQSLQTMQVEVECNLARHQNNTPFNQWLCKVVNKWAGRTVIEYTVVHDQEHPDMNLLKDAIKRDVDRTNDRAIYAFGFDMISPQVYVAHERGQLDNRFQWVYAIDTYVESPHNLTVTAESVVTTMGNASIVIERYSDVTMHHYNGRNIAVFHSIGIREFIRARHVRMTEKSRLFLLWLIRLVEQFADQPSAMPSSAPSTLLVNDSSSGGDEVVSDRALEETMPFDSSEYEEKGAPIVNNSSSLSPPVVHAAPSSEVPRGLHRVVIDLLSDSDEEKMEVLLLPFPPSQTQYVPTETLLPFPPSQTQVPVEEHHPMEDDLKEEDPIDNTDVRIRGDLFNLEDFIGLCGLNEGDKKIAINSAIEDRASVFIVGGQYYIHKSRLLSMHASSSAFDTKCKTLFSSFSPMPARLVHAVGVDSNNVAQVAFSSKAALSAAVDGVAPDRRPDDVLRVVTPSVEMRQPCAFGFDGGYKTLIAYSEHEYTITAPQNEWVRSMAPLPGAEGFMLFASDLGKALGYGKADSSVQFVGSVQVKGEWLVPLHALIYECIVAPDLRPTLNRDVLLWLARLVTERTGIPVTVPESTIPLADRKLVYAVGYEERSERIHVAMNADEAKDLWYQWFRTADTYSSAPRGLTLLDDDIGVHLRSVFPRSDIRPKDASGKKLITKYEIAFKLERRKQATYDGAIDVHFLNWLNVLFTKWAGYGIEEQLRECEHKHPEEYARLMAR